jgi:hypothetical protein
VSAQTSNVLQLKIDGNIFRVLPGFVGFFRPFQEKLFANCGQKAPAVRPISGSGLVTEVSWTNPICNRVDPACFTSAQICSRMLAYLKKNVPRQCRPAAAGSLNPNAAPLQPYLFFAATCPRATCRHVCSWQMKYSFLRLTTLGLRG